MRIAMVAVEHPDRLTDLARELAGLGHQVTIHTRREQPGTRRRYPTPGVIVDVVSAGPPRPLAGREVRAHLGVFGQGLAARWAAQPPDVVHAHGWVSGLAVLTALDGARQVPTLQSYGLLAAASAQAPIEGMLGRAAAASAVGCCQDRDELAGLGVPRTRIRVVPAGVDVHEFTERGPAYPRGTRRRLVLMAGPAPEDGAAVAVRALAWTPDAELVVAGGPAPLDLETDPDVHRLLLLAKQEGVVDRLIVLGRVPRRKVPQLLRSADLVLATGRHDPYAAVAVEAMACGRPVVATGTGGHLDTVVDGVNGVLVPAVTGVGLARVLRRLLADPMHLTALGIAAADRARSRHSWARIAAETAAVYQRIG